MYMINWRLRLYLVRLMDGSLLPILSGELHIARQTIHAALRSGLYLPVDSFDTGPFSTGLYALAGYFAVRISPS
jgi:hypothetical protein